MTIPDDNEILAILVEALRTSRRITVPASGLSMGRAFCRADAVIIAAADDLRLTPGMIIVFQRNTRWIAHRVIWIFGKGSADLCITKGDGLHVIDRPFVSRSENIGVVVGLWRDGHLRDLMTVTARVYSLLRIIAGIAALPVFALLRRLRYERS